MGISEHAAYIKGLFDGYELDKSSKEGRIISEMLTLMADMADKIKALEAFTAAADGKATKIIIPSEIQGLAGRAASAKAFLSDDKTEE